jgi:hypothetical protein
MKEIFVRFTKEIERVSGKVGITWRVFLASFIAAIIVDYSTVYFHAWKISITNAVKALKYE